MSHLTPGMIVKRVLRLCQMLKNPLCLGLFACLSITSEGYAQPPAPEKRAPKHSESFVDMVLRITGISATSRGLKGDPIQSPRGDVMVVDVSNRVSQHFGPGGGCRSPIFSIDDKRVLTLRNDL